MDALRDLWEEFIEFDGPEHLGMGALYLLLCVLAGRLLHLSVRRLNVRHAARGTRPLWTECLSASERAVSWALVLFGVWLFVQRLPLLDTPREVLYGVLYTACLIALTSAAAQIGRTLVDGYAQRLAARHGEPADIGVFALVRKVVTVFVWTVGTMIVLRHFKIDVMSIATALGVGSLAIGLAARETLGNMISGFTLLIDRPFREGDRVRLATTEIGDVREIGLRSTRIQLLDATWLIVPNNELVNSRVTNLTWPVQHVQAKAVFLLPYGSDVPAAKSALLALAREHAEVLAEPPPSADVTVFADAALTLELGVWVKDPRRGGAVAESLRVAALEALKARGVELTLPARHVRASAGGAPAVAPLGSGKQV